MAMPEPFIQITLAEYLDQEDQASVRHEYVDGIVFAMVVAKRRHNLVVGNVFHRARIAARSSPHCQVFSSDMKLYVQSRNSIYYPDVMATCDPDDRDERYVTRPCFIVEVLSPSTSGIDRREKRLSYEALTSLREYLVVDQDRMRVELHRKEQDQWQGLLLRQPNDVVRSSCLGLQLTLADLYEGIELPPPGVTEDDAADYPFIEWLRAG